MAQSISLNFLLHSSLSLFLRNTFSFLSHQLSRSHELLFQFITTNSLFFQSCLRPTIDALTSHHIHVQLKSSPAQEKSFLSQKKEFLQIFVLQRSTFFFAKSLLKIIAFRVLQKIYFATGSIHWTAVCNFLALSYINTWIGLISIFLTYKYHKDGQIRKKIMTYIHFKHFGKQWKDDVGEYFSNSHTLIPSLTGE